MKSGADDRLASSAFLLCILTASLALAATDVTAFTASMEGRFAEANKIAAQNSVVTQELVLVRFHHWDDILKLPEPSASDISARALWHFARGMAFGAKKTFYEADAERDSLLKAIATLPGDAMMDLNRTRDVLNLVSHLLEGSIAMNRVSMAGAVAHFEAAVQIEDALHSDGAPAWFIPARESLGRALMTASRFVEAEQAFRVELARHPGNGRALFGLWQSLREQGKKAEAKQAENQFRATWKNADVKLTLEDL
jgi:tetratricopeptide (TPR) repeat protein